MIIIIAITECVIYIQFNMRLLLLLLLTYFVCVSVCMRVVFYGDVHRSLCQPVDTIPFIHPIHSDDDILLFIIIS